MSQSESDVEDFNDSDSEEPEDNLVYSDSDDTENDEEEEAVAVIRDTDENLVSKNGKIWHRRPNVSTPQRVTTTIQLLSGTPQTSAAVKPSDHLKLFIDEESVNLIVKHTNAKIKKLVKKQKKKQRYCQPTDNTEIYALIGILFFSGITKSSRQSTADLWSWKYGPLIFRTTMTRNRFLFLMRALRFDDFDHRDRNDKFSPIQKLWTHFTMKCITNYNPGTFLTVDETMLGLVYWVGIYIFQINMSVLRHIHRTYIRLFHQETL